MSALVPLLHLGEVRLEALHHEHDEDLAGEGRPVLQGQKHQLQHLRTNNDVKLLSYMDSIQKQHLSKGKS